MRQFIESGCRLLKSLIFCALVMSGTLAFGDAREAALLESSVSRIRAGKAPTVVSTLRMLSRSTDVSVARPAAFWLARGALEQKTLVRASEAEKMLRTLADGTVKDAWQEQAVILLARRTWNDGNQQEALLRLDRLLSGGRNSPWMVLAAELAGDIYANEPNKSKAIEAYTFALKTAGYFKGYEARAMPEELNLSRIKKKLAALQAKPAKEPKHDEPADTFKKAERNRAGGNYDLAIRQYDRIISEYPDHILADASGYWAGWCLQQRGKFMDAEERWRLFIKAKPAGPWRGQAMTGMGDLFLERDLDAEKAEALFKAVVDGSANGETWIEARPDALERYGICLFMKRDFDGAEKCFAEELRLRPKREFQGHEIPSQMQFLKEMCSKKKYPVKYPEKVMMGSPKARTALFLAAAYGECGSYDRANRFLDMVADGKLPGTMPVHKAYACYDKADNLKLLGKTDEAEAMFRKCAKDYFTTFIAPLALLELANLQFAENRNSEADATLREVWTRFSTSPEAAKARYNFGWSMYFDEKWQASLDAFNQLARKYPGTWEAGKAREAIIPDLITKIREETR